MKMMPRTELFWRTLAALALCLLVAPVTYAIGGKHHVTEVIDGVEWTTAKNLPFVGDPNAKKGGEIRRYIPQYIPTLRNDGPNATLTTITDIYGMTHETLLSLHEETHELEPQLATHWRVSEDGQTFWYRIDPRARFSNGKEVTAADAVASFKHLVNPDIKDPSAAKLYGDMYETPVAESKYVVRIKSKTKTWRGLIYFAIFTKIYPADEISIPGDVYLSEFNWKQIPGSGPYHFEDYDRDLKQEQSITITRRNDWWRQDHPQFSKWYNFDKIHFTVVRERPIAFEKLKAGELDFMVIYTSQRWVQECDTEKFKNGWIQRRKVYTEEPNSYSGFMFNMREFPFNDKNVRLAFCYGWNRTRLFEKFFFNEYDFVDSYYPGGPEENLKNRKVRFNKARAERLLDRAGYTKRNADGYRVHEKTGKTLEFLLEFTTPTFEKINKIVAEDMKAIGMKMDLKLVDYTALRKRVSERNFKLWYQSWRAPTFRNPMDQWHSDLAGKNSNNISGFQNQEVDQLIEEYEVCFDADRRSEIIRTIDGIVYKEYTAALSWYGPFKRILYWNRYGQPETYLTRFTDERIIMHTWWYDEEKDKVLKKAVAENTSLPVGELIVDPWGAKARMTAPKEKAPKKDAKVPGK